MENDKIDDMLIGRIYKKQYAATRDDINKIVASKIAQKIDEKKREFIDSLKSSKNK